MSTIRIPTLRFLALTNLALIHPASLIYLPICIMFSKFHTTPYLRTNVRRILFTVYRITCINLCLHVLHVKIHLLIIFVIV